jgi:hypothetical protein
VGSFPIEPEPLTAGGGCEENSCPSCPAGASKTPVGLAGPSVPATRAESDPGRAVPLVPGRCAEMVFARLGIAGTGRCGSCGSLVEGMR